MDSYKSKYRPCVGIMLINNGGLVWIGERMMSQSNQTDQLLWQMPQGGIDDGEKPLNAAKRELYEETSVSSISVMAEAQEWLTYEIPSEIGNRKTWNKKYKGQCQRWFAFRFDGDDSEIDIFNPPDGHKQEFTNWRWESAARIPELVIPFKRDVYRKVVEIFSQFTN